MKCTAFSGSSLGSDLSSACANVTTGTDSREPASTMLRALIFSFSYVLLPQISAELVISPFRCTGPHGGRRDSRALFETANRRLLDRAHPPAPSTANAPHALEESLENLIHLVFLIASQTRRDTNRRVILISAM